jgi:pilus assembly protein CpaE
MSKRALENKVKKAEAAYRKHDRRMGARLVDEILQRDFLHRGAWELLHRLYSNGMGFEEFQKYFTQRFYPDKLQTLIAAPLPNGSSAQTEPKAKGLKAFLARFKKTKASSPQDMVPASSILDAGKDISVSGSSHPTASPDTAAPETQTKMGQTAPFISSSFTKELEKPGPTERIQVADQNAPVETPVSSAEKTRIILVDDIAQTRETIIRSLRFQQNIEVVGSASNGLQAIELARSLKPHVVVMDMNMPGMDGISATAVIKRDMPAIEIIILTVQDDLRYMRQAMLAGARDFLAKPPMIDDLIQTILSAGEQARHNLERLPTLGLATSEGEGIKTGKVITVYSPRGGSGNTMLAVNLAFGLHRGDTSVVLVDGDLQFGDVAVHANTQIKNTILDLAPRVEELDPEIVNEVLSTHPSGLKILNPPRLERAELVTGEQFQQLLRYLSTIFSLVIVDTPHRINETTQAAFSASDLILLVSTIDIPSIARTRKFLESATAFNLDPEHISLIVNQFDPRVGIGLDKLTQAFGKEPSAVVPFVYAEAVESINRGVPILSRSDSAQKTGGQALRQVVQFVRSRLNETKKSVISEEIFNSN